MTWLFMDAVVALFSSVRMDIPVPKGKGLLGENDLGTWLHTVHVGSSGDNGWGGLLRRHAALSGNSNVADYCSIER